MQNIKFDLSVSIDENSGAVRMAYLRVRDGVVAETKEFDGHATADYDERGQLLGVEFLAPCNIQFQGVLLVLLNMEMNMQDNEKNKEKQNSEQPKTNEEMAEFLRERFLKSVQEFDEFSAEIKERMSRAPGRPASGKPRRPGC